MGTVFAAYNLLANDREDGALTGAASQITTTSSPASPTGVSQPPIVSTPVATPTSLSEIMTPKPTATIEVALSPTTEAPVSQISITFDDGYESVYLNAFPVMKEFGIVGNIAIVTGSVGQKSGALSWEQVDELYREGWGILSHTVSHPDLPDLSDEDLDYELRQSKETLADRGFQVDYLVYPRHASSVRVKEAAAAYYKGARGKARYQLSHYHDTDPFDLPSYAGDYFIEGEHPDLTMKHLFRFLKNAHNEGISVDIYFHQIYAVDLDDFRDLIREINDRGYKTGQFGED